MGFCEYVIQAQWCLPIQGLQDHRLRIRCSMRFAIMQITVTKIKGHFSHEIQADTSHKKLGWTGEGRERKMVVWGATP